jgi:histidinol-phosphate/aromatic aminotransferase/cobyric acid decarboxylase-like protein
MLKDYFRVSVGSAEDNDRLTGALKNIISAR